MGPPQPTLQLCEAPVTESEQLVNHCLRLRIVPCSRETLAALSDMGSMPIHSLAAHHGLPENLYKTSSYGTLAGTETSSRRAALGGVA